MKHITIVVIILSIIGCYNGEPEKSGMEGQPMPSFKILLSDSATVIDSKNFSSDKPVVLFYFGPYCPYSKAQMNDIIEDIDKLKDIKFYALTNWPFSEMKQFQTNYGLNKFPNITVGYDFNNFFADYYKPSGVPYIVIYGKNKKLNAEFLGKINSSQITKIAKREI